MLYLVFFLLGVLGGCEAQKDGSECSLVLSATTEPQVQTETDPGTNGCQARITSPPGTNINITFIASNCDQSNRDLQVYITGNSQLKLKLCRALETSFGATWPLPLTILTDNDVLLYETASDLTFQVEYSYVPLVENNNFSETSCSIVSLATNRLYSTTTVCNVESPIKVDTTPGHITSPNYNIGPYLNYEECTVTLEATPECQIRLESRSSLEDNTDFLKVCPDVPEGDPACTSLATKEFSNDTFTAVNNATVTFTSDVYGSWFGFSMAYSCIPVFSGWGPWSIAGCRRKPNNHGGYYLVRKEVRYRECLLVPCQEEDLMETVLTPCFDGCTEKCCRTPTVQH